MAEFYAEALTKVGQFEGNCVISVNKEAISVKDASDMSSIAKWQYSKIRKFRTDPAENVFIFESGSHGPFGVAEYHFELVKEDLHKLQTTITGFTGAHFNTKALPRNITGKIDPVDTSIKGDMEGVVLRNPRSPSFSNPEVCLEKVKALARVDHSTEEGDEGKRKTRVNVYTELVKTEHDYVADLKIVIDAYYDAMDPESSMSIPLRLRGKRDVVFGNLLDIYNFHDKVFSHALEFFDKCPERVGDCFMQFAAEFELYSVYCKNRPKSEVLVNETTESQAFFKGIQRNLGHALDLNAYLLKPVQRITKYQLLLKDLVKHSSDIQSAVGELEAAHTKMKKILQELNDSMHTAGLTGLPDDLPEPGKLLAHDRFQVAVLEAGPLTFSRSREKHVFLFEKVIVLSKKTEAVEGNQKRAKKTEVYQYREHLDMTAITLRESVDENHLAFALSLHKQQKEYRFEAQTCEVQNMWVTEIRRLLQLQFAILKLRHEKAVDGYYSPPVPKREVGASLRTMSDSCEDLVSSYPSTEKGYKRRSAVLTEKPPQITNKVEAKTIEIPPGRKLKKRNGSDPGSLTESPPLLPKDLNPCPTYSPPLPPREPIPYEVPRESRIYSNEIPMSEMKNLTIEQKQVHPERKSLPDNSRPLNGRKRSEELRGGLQVDNSVYDAIDTVHSKDMDSVWCVCGYRDNNHKEPLVVIGKGEGSVDGLKQHLHDDNIAFGLLKVVETIDGIQMMRFVYIQWIGERSKTMAKVKTTTHRAQLEELFEPHNVAIFATSRNDITDRIIMDKVTNISGSKSHVL